MKAFLEERGKWTEELKKGKTNKERRHSRNVLVYKHKETCIYTVQMKTGGKEGNEKRKKY